MVQLVLPNCYWSSLFQGKKLSFYSGDLPQLYTLLLTSIMSCQVSKREKCQKRKEHNARKANWRGVTMLPGWRIARITITTHDSTMTEHSERNVTDTFLSQQFFWSEMLQNVCTFCRNCNKCCINNSWKDCWQGFLKPLPVLKRIWQKIFINFVVDLLSSEGCMNLLIITDCLSKRIILKLCKNMTAEWVTQTFVTSWSEMPRILGLEVCACWYKGPSARCRVNQ